MHKAFDSVRSGSMQEKALLALIEISAFMRQDSELQEVTRTELMERSGVTTTVIAAMAKKGIVDIYKKRSVGFHIQDLSQVSCLY